MFLVDQKESTTGLALFWLGWGALPDEQASTLAKLICFAVQLTRPGRRSVILGALPSAGMPATARTARA
jgi:hypothetical protein